MLTRTTYRRKKRVKAEGLIPKGIRVRDVIPQATSVAASTLLRDGLVEGLKV